MLATALTSAFVSNTATAAMMLPIALGVVRWAEASAASGAGIAPQQLTDFRTAMMLAVAYAASIGGLTTLVGSPPNGYLAQFVTDSLHKQLTFASWLWVGLPCALILLPVAWWMLTHVLFRLPRSPFHGGAESLRAEIAALGTMGAPQKRTIAVFLVAVVLWLGQPFLPAVISRLGDAGIAILAALALFIIPSGDERGRKLLRWSEAERIPWGVLLLFGGGLSLAAAVERNGVSQLMAAAVQGLDGWPPGLLIVLVTTSVTFLTEMASNVAVTATLVPLLAAMAPGLGLAPELLILPATLAASCAFMMPAGTPPNAIVFGSGYLTIPQMVRAGWWINWIAIVVISLVVSAIAVRCEVIG
jgi:sodium-dependent dicarboxylate transporter 2/3/5